MSKFEEKIRKRWERFESRGHEYTIIDNSGNYAVITNRGYKGIADSQGIIKIPPVYDDIMIYPSFNMASVTMEGLMAVIDVLTGDLLTDFKYDHLEYSPADHSIILCKDGLKGIFSVMSKSVVHEPQFSDINKSVSSRFSWMFSPSEGYFMEDSATGKSVYLGNDIDECFDETHEHIFIYKNKKIAMLSENGTEDIIGYRKLLSSLGGRISLYNSSRHTSAIADIYGCVL